MDMWGSRGGRRRRRFIRAEFVVGAVGCTALGVLGIVSGTGWLIAVGIWLIGVGANYVPLALHAQSLSRPGVLEAELENVDIRAELRHAGLSQFWIALPFAVALAAAKQAREDRHRANSA